MAAVHPQSNLFEPRADASGNAPDPLLTKNTSPRGQEGTAIIKIYDQIGPWGYSHHQLLRELDQVKDVDAIQLRLHSGGGSAFMGFFMANAIRRKAKELGAQIETVCDGLALSIASYLFLLGEKRTIAENGFLMIHTAWSDTRGNADALEHTAKLLRQLDPKIRDLTALRVSLSKAEIDEAMRVNGGAGTWYDSEAAVDLGFATDIEDLEAPESASAENLAHYPGKPNSNLWQDGAVPESAVAAWSGQEKQDDEDALAAACLACAESYEVQPEEQPAGDAEAEILALIEQTLAGEK